MIPKRIHLNDVRSSVHFMLNGNYKDRCSDIHRMFLCNISPDSSHWSEHNISLSVTNASWFPWRIHAVEAVDVIYSFSLHLCAWNLNEAWRKLIKGDMWPSKSLSLCWVSNFMSLEWKCQSELTRRKTYCYLVPVPKLEPKVNVTSFYFFIRVQKLLIEMFVTWSNFPNGASKTRMHSSRMCTAAAVVAAIICRGSISRGSMSRGLCLGVSVQDGLSPNNKITFTIISWYLNCFHNRKY